MAEDQRWVRFINRVLGTFDSHTITFLLTDFRYPEKRTAAADTEDGPPKLSEWDTTWLAEEGKAALKKFTAACWGMLARHLTVSFI